MDILNLINRLVFSSGCPSCGLQGTLKICPKCGREACDKCIAVDESDCMFCGPQGDIAKEVFASFHKRSSK